MIQTFQLPSGTYSFIKVPEWTHGIALCQSTYGSFVYVKSEDETQADTVDIDMDKKTNQKWEILGIVKDIPEDVAAGIVGRCFVSGNNPQCPEEIPAVEALLSLSRSKGFDEKALMIKQIKK